MILRRQTVVRALTMIIKEIPMRYLLVGAVLKTELAAVSLGSQAILQSCWSSPRVLKKGGLHRR